MLTDLPTILDLAYCYTIVESNNNAVVLMQLINSKYRPTFVIGRKQFNELKDKLRLRDENSI